MFAKPCRCKAGMGTTSVKPSAPTQEELRGLDTGWSVMHSQGPRAQSPGAVLTVQGGKVGGLGHFTGDFIASLTIGKERCDNRSWVGFLVTGVLNTLECAFIFLALGEWSGGEVHLPTPLSGGHIPWGSFDLLLLFHPVKVLRPCPPCLG